ncbi:MAG: hypothetical protein RL513_1490 [Pseudomonadota bacterium]
MTALRASGHSRLTRIFLALLPLVWALVHAIAGPGWQGIERLDAMLQDIRTRLTLPRTLDPRIVIVDIDERSLSEVGRWPWPRDRLAILLDELFDRQDVALVGFGRVFDAPDESAGLSRLRQLADQELRDVPAFRQRLTDLESRLDHDARFAQALRERPVVLGYHVSRDAAGHATGELPAPVLPADGLGGHDGRITAWTGYIANIARLAQAAPAAGFLEAHTDPDGLVRAVPLLASIQGRYHETLALAMYRALLGAVAIEPAFAPTGWGARFHGVERLVLSQGGSALGLVPVSGGVVARLPFRGPGGAAGGSFRYIPAADLIAGRVPPRSLEGKLVLVGATATALDASHATPVGPHYPSIELHATLLSGLLDGRLPVRPDHASGYGLLVLIGAGLLLALALPALAAAQAVLLFTAVIAAIVALNVWLSVMAGLLLPLAPALLMATGSFTLSMAHAQFMQHRRRRGLIRLLGAEASPQLVQQMIAQDAQPDARAVRRDLTVMFCDIRGFTRLSEALAPPAVQELLNGVLGDLTEVIHHHGGTVDKYVGDCVMAFWGAPVDLADHASRALAAARALSQAVDAVNARHHRRGLPPIQVGIGLNSGAVCVGDMGPPQRRVYTAVGEAVNLAARLERLSCVYGVTLVAGEALRSEVPQVDWLELDKVRLMGHAHALPVYTPVSWPGADVPPAPEVLRNWSAFLKAYRAQDVLSCERLLASLPYAPGLPPRLCTLYAQRVTALRGRPFDPDWDGATSWGLV